MIETLAGAVALSGAPLLLLPLIVLAAAAVRGYAGFGFSAIVVAAASLFIPPREAVPLVLALEVLASIQMARQVWPHINWRLVSHILLGVAVFSPIGQSLLRWAPVEPMRTATALLLLLAIGLVAAGKFFPLKNARPTWLLTGVVSGFMNGLLAMGGMWTMVFLINSGVQAAVLRASLIALFFITDCYALTVASVNELLDEKLFWRVLYALPFMLLGVRMGARRFNPVQQARYRKVVLIILLLLALLLLARAAV